MSLITLIQWTQIVSYAIKGKEGRKNERERGREKKKQRKTKKGKERKEGTSNLNKAIEIGARIENETQEEIFSFFGHFCQH